MSLPFHQGFYYGPPQLTTDRRSPLSSKDGFAFDSKKRSIGNIKPFVLVNKLPYNAYFSLLLYMYWRKLLIFITYELLIVEFDGPI